MIRAEGKNTQENTNRLVTAPVRFQNQIRVRSRDPCGDCIEAMSKSLGQRNDPNSKGFLLEKAHLRHEARSVTWSQLDHAQRSALQRMIALLKEAVDSLPPSTGRDEPVQSPLLDSQRASRIVFLSGERGTGKTTVLLSLIGACVLAKVSTEAPQGFLRDPEDRPLWEDLCRMCKRLVWLEAIDMEPLPASTNLMAAILARIDLSVKPDEFGSSDAGGRRSTHGLLDPSPDYHEALLGLQELMTSVALAWDGNIVQRAGSLDPDTYAVEVMRAEQARLSLNRKMNKVLDQLTSRVFNRGDTRDPLFVLPVDDFDMNPPRSLDLLRLLRAISVPRLFNVVLGDVRVAEVVFNLKLSGALVDVAGNPRCCDLLGVQPERVQSLATELAANATRKLIPPAQEVRLMPMTIAETLYYRPIDTAADDERLYQLLERCYLGIETDNPNASIRHVGENLYGFLVVVPDQIDTGGPATAQPQPAPSADEALARPEPAHRSLKTIEGEVRRSPYSAKVFLKTTPRRAADLWQSIRAGLRDRLVAGSATATGERDSAPTQFLDVLVDACKKAVLEDIALTYEQRDMLRRTFERGEGDEWEFDSSAYEEEPRVGSGITLPLPAKSIPSGAAVVPGTAVSPGGSPAPVLNVLKIVQARQTVHACRGKGWRLWAGGTRDLIHEPGRPRRIAPPMEDETASLIMLLQDVFVMRHGHRWVGRQLMPNLPVLKQWAVTEWRVDYWLKTTVTWPTPIWSTFWAYDRFLGRWNSAIDRLSASTASIGHAMKLLYLAFVWIDAATTVLGWSDFEKLPEPTGPLDWSNLAGNVAAMVTGQAGGHELVEDSTRYWVLDVAYMLLPEVTGIGDTVCSSFTSIPGLNNFWLSQIEEMRSYRLRVLRSRFADVGMVELANDLGGRVPPGLPDRLKVAQLLFSRTHDQGGVFIDADSALRTSSATSP